MQSLWARVLAGEANSPGRYSKRTLAFLSTLQKNEAEGFTALCRFTANFGGWNPFQTDVQQEPLRCPVVLNPADPIYHQHGITAVVLADLASIGLITFNAALSHSADFDGERTTIKYFDEFGFVTFPTNGCHSVPLGSVSFSRTGHELCRLAIEGGEKVPGFLFYLADTWRSKGAFIASPFPLATVSITITKVPQTRTSSLFTV